MKKIYIYIKYIAIICVILGIIYYLFFYNQKQAITTSTTKTEIVALGSIKNSIDVSGNAGLVNEQSLRFNQTGKVIKVNFKAGSKIKKGDIIAELDKSEGEKKVNEAKLNLENAKLALNQLYEKKDESQFIQAKNSITNTKNNIKTAKEELQNLQNSQNDSLNDLQKNISNISKDLENLKLTQNNSINDLQKDILNKNQELTNLKSSYELAINDLEYSKKQLSNNYSNSKSNKENTINQIQESFSQELTNIDKIIEQCDYILGFTQKNKSKNDYYETYLSAKDTQAKNQAENYLAISINTRDSLENLINSYNSGDVSQAINILNKILENYKNLQLATDYTYKALENSIDNNIFTQSDIDGKKSNIYSFKTNSQNKIVSTTSQINTLNTLSDLDLLSSSNDNSIKQKQENINSINLNITKKQQEISTYQNNYQTTLKSYELALQKKQQELQQSQNNYKNTKNNYEITLLSKKQSIQNLENTLSLNNQSLEELYKGPTDENVLKAQNNIKQAQMSLESAYDDLEKYNLEAPFDGIIRKIDYQVGDNLLSDSDKYVYIENPNMLEIGVKLDQIDIVKVNLGDKAIIKFDGYPNQKVNAIISSIDTTPIETSGVVSYEVKLVLDDEKFDKKILSGMTADIEIITEQKNNVPIISTTFLTTKGDKTYVDVLKNGQTKQTEIKTGISSDGKVQIISGLEVGDKITKTITSKSGTSSSKSSLFSVPGSGNKSSSSSNRSQDMGGPPM